ncbi:MAG: hypothetical protein GY854_29245 [Deltaproteobacteria bacterium]|nr:hypothetical protein [Deltaproteobacteria bacterium]
MTIVSNVAALLAASDPAPSSTSISLAVWKWVIIIGVAAVIVFYVIKRVADVVVKRKTDAMIRDVVGKDADVDDNE